MEKIILAAGAMLLLGAALYMSTPQTTTFLGEPQYPTDVIDLYADWKRKYNKKYGSEEDSYRLQVFYENYLKINQFYKAGAEQNYELGFTQFMDITNEEFRATYLGWKGTQPTVMFETLEDPATNDVDWVSRGAVTGVKNQGQCGSCWSFSTTGALEGLDAVKYAKHDSFSEQQLVDCSGSYGNQGCNGGLMDNAFKYVRDHGITLESSYPYRGVQGSCQNSSGSFKISGFRDVAPGDCNGLAAAVANQPVSVAVDANNWQFYRGGIFNSCGTSLDHGVLLVGVTSDAWKIKNSWGTGWGESGYIRLARGNTCGVCNAASYPVA